MNDLLDKEFNRIVGEVLKSKRERKGISLQELSNKINNKSKGEVYKIYLNVSAKTSKIAE